MHNHTEKKKEKERKEEKIEEGDTVANSQSSLMNDEILCNQALWERFFCLTVPKIHISILSNLPALKNKIQTKKATRTLASKII